MDRQSALDLYSKVTSRFRRDLVSGKMLDIIGNSQNYDLIVYTYLHRKTIFDLGSRLGIPVKELYAAHDLDKMISYLYLPDQGAHNLHVMLAPHHDTQTQDKSVLIEMILDWESARFTKPDKPLNAYDTLYKYYAPMESRVLPILKTYKLDTPTNFEEVISPEAYDKLARQVSPINVLFDIIQSYDL